MQLFSEMLSAHILFKTTCTPTSYVACQSSGNEHAQMQFMHAQILEAKNNGNATNILTSTGSWWILKLTEVLC